MSNLDTSSFDMSALMDACRDISANQEVEDKVKKTNLFMRHVLERYNDKMNQKLMKKRRNLKTRSKMSVY